MLTSRSPQLARRVPHSGNSPATAVISAATGFAADSVTQHPGRVFSRAQLLQEVWGYDYFGGTRTVDVHVRRLRAKLGPEHEALIGTVRNVGYRFVPARPDEATVSTLDDDAQLDEESEVESRSVR